jgi:hypothetical protein
MEAYQFPWPEPRSPYDADGPVQDLEFELQGAKLKVSLTKDYGCDTGRPRYRVECLTCSKVLHENTTSASIRCEQHLREKHS